MALLPWELLRSETNQYVFASPDSGVQRTLLETPQQIFEKPQKPRVLFAWSHPPGTVEFDPKPHTDKLSAIFADQLTVLENASPDAIGKKLAEASAKNCPFDYLHILAHGFRENEVGGLCLNSNSGGRFDIDSARFALLVRDHGLRLVFLCSCKTAVSGVQAFSGVAQQLLLYGGGDIPHVVATQAVLPVRGSAELAERFYRLLVETANPAQALSEARRNAYTNGDTAWSVPVLYCRPQPMLILPEGEAAPLPDIRKTYQSREAFEDQILKALQSHRLVSVEGLPGIGKTELGIKVAHQALDNALIGKIIFVQSLPGFTTDQVRAIVAAALGQTGVKDDATLAAIIQSFSHPILLLLDNAEDLMRIDKDEIALRDQVNTLLARTTRLHILMTTRWALDGVSTDKHSIPIPPMSDKEIQHLLVAELTDAGIWNPQWLGSPNWRELIKMIDGHPRSLSLIAGHFTTLRDLGKVVGLLRVHRDKAIVEPGLFGREDKFAALSEDSKARLRSLAATMDLSFELLRERYPQAADLFLALSFFEGGLAESVANAVAGGSASMALYQLYHYNLIITQNERVFFPVPLQWYAKRKWQESGLNEEPYLRNALTAYAYFSAACDSLILSGAIVSGVSRLILEERPLLLVAEWTSKHSEINQDQSQLARIAINVQNAFSLADLIEPALKLVRLALPLTRSMADRLGEANTLRSLGDLLMRVDDLEGARKAYAEALPIYREIHARLGEANTLKSLGDLLMLVDDLEGARRNYAEALPIYREIHARLGEANTLKSLGDLLMRVDDLEGARKIYAEALPIFREIQDRLGEANTLQSRGDLLMRVDDLEGARKAYAEALPIYREIHARLGEANSLQSLGDLLMRVDDLEGARKANAEALPIYREIHNRLGEANTLQSLALLALKDGKVNDAFLLLLTTLDIYKKIDNRLGEQAIFGYLARVAAAANQRDQSLLLAEESLGIGRQIQDRFGQRINLEHQLQLFQEEEEWPALLAALMQMQDLDREMNDNVSAESLEEPIHQLKNALPSEIAKAVSADPEAARQEAIERARERFAKTGRKLLDPPPDSDKT